jgi:hypothetical protein
MDDVVIAGQDGGGDLEPDRRRHRASCVQSHRRFERAAREREDVVRHEIGRRLEGSAVEQMHQRMDRPSVVQGVDDVEAAHH